MRGYLRNEINPCWKWVKTKTNFASVNTETWNCQHCLMQVPSLSYEGTYNPDETSYNHDLRKRCECQSANVELHNNGLPPMEDVLMDEGMPETINDDEKEY